jgi:hypothetical protein
MSAASHRRAIILATAPFACLGLGLLLLGQEPSSRGSWLGIGFGSFHTGRLAGVSFENRPSGFVTNRTGLLVKLDDAVLLWKRPQGAEVLIKPLLWRGQDRWATCRSGEIAALPLDVPSEARSYCLAFTYHRDGGRFRSLVGNCMQGLRPRLLPEKVATWLAMHGWWDGALRRKYVGPWLANEGSSPVRVDPTTPTLLSSSSLQRPSTPAK